MKDYERTREFKISKVLEKCYEQLGPCGNLCSKVVDYIENNPKCKLPWTNTELLEAKADVMELLKDDGLEEEEGEGVKDGED